MTATANETDLKTRWQRLQSEQPKIRIRDAAMQLNISEAELLATDCGAQVTRLTTNFGALLKELKTLGKVLAITRNREVVHERTGSYSKIELFPDHGNMGQVLDEGIDLRLFLNAWQLAFAVADEAHQSLQFFDLDGTAVHKIFLTPDSNETAFADLVGKFRSENQSSVQTVTPKSPKPPDKPDGEIDIITFRSRWAAMKDTHEFFQLTREFGAGREQALRLADDEMAFQVEPSSYRAILETAAHNQLNIMVFVGNDGVIQIHSGTVEKVFPQGEWFNVMDAAFNLHINEPGIARTWVVRKPTVDGIVSSLELYNQQNENVALFFSKRKPGETESEAWRELLKSLTRL